MVCDAEEISESDCCGNGCTNCILDHKPQPSAKAVLAGKRNILDNYTKFKLLAKSAHSPALVDEVLELHFGCVMSASAADCMLDIPPGHHVMMRAPACLASTSQAMPTQLLRPYSPYWHRHGDNMEFKILVNLRPAGAMTACIARLQPGDEVEFRGPIGAYAHAAAASNAKEPKCLYVIAQGVATAATLPIVSAVLDNEDDMCRVYHVICCSDLAHLYFRAQLSEFAQFWNYRSRIYVAHAQCNSLACTQAGSCGATCAAFKQSLRYREAAVPARFDAAALRALHATARQTNANTPQEGADEVYVVAGSATFQRNTLAMIRQVDVCVKEENIFLL